MKNIVLIGMPGCGKSSIGEVLAKKLCVPFYDADILLEKREKRSIKDFFAESENAFRDAETRTIKYLSQLENVIIATGGGVVKREENMTLLSVSGTIIFIDRRPEDIICNITGDSRPLLAQDKKRIFELYEERIDLYKKYADIIVQNKTFEETVDKLFNIIQKKDR